MEVAAPDPGWPAAYQAVAAELRPVLGPALRAIEHVGSTSIPGLAAKPVIDVMAALDRLEDADLVALAALGFRPIDTGMSGRLFLRREAGDGGPAVHLHLVTAESFGGRKERRFRDRLLAQPEEAALYEAEKRRLAALHAGDADAYTRAKTAVIQGIMDRDADARGLPREDVWED